MTRRKAAPDAIVQQVRAEYRPNVRGFGYAALSRKYGIAESTVRDWVRYWVRA